MKFALLMMAAVSFAAAGEVQPVDPTLLHGYQAMYNLRFDEAHRDFTRFRQDHPADPLGPASSAAAWLFSEFERLRILQSEFFTHNDTFLSFQRPPADPSVKRSFESAIASAHALSEMRLRETPGDPAALLASTILLGLSSNYSSLIEKKNLDALRLVKESRAAADKLLAGHPEYYDAHIAAGVENYLLSQRALPVRWFLRAAGAQTDLRTGIQQLEITAEKGHYLLPYARLLLAVADLRANDRASARTRLEWLSQQFPGNALYRQELERLR